jgi:hypothetical protein
MLMTPEQQDLWKQVRQRQIEEMEQQRPRIGDKVLVDVLWDNNSITTPNPTVKGRILGIDPNTETYFVSLSPSGIRKYVPQEAIKLGY